jgi:hypothetical protein
MKTKKKKEELQKCLSSVENWPAMSVRNVQQPNQWEMKESDKKAAGSIDTRWFVEQQ